METTQAPLNEFITFHQFTSTPWKQGFPSYLVQFISDITGNKAQTLKYFKKIHQSVSTLTQFETDKYLPTDAKFKTALTELNTKQYDSEDSEVSFESQNSDNFKNKQLAFEKDVKELRKGINNDGIWANLTTAFKTLAVYRKPNTVPETIQKCKYMSLFYITE